ncbi:MAG: nicotinamide mononucleotide transporter [Mycoplasma sp.]
MLCIGYVNPKITCNNLKNIFLGDIWFLGINYLIKDILSLSKAMLLFLGTYLCVAIWGLVINLQEVTLQTTPFSMSLNLYYAISAISSITSVFGMFLAMKGKISSFFWYFFACLSFIPTSYATGFMGDTQYAILATTTVIVAFWYWKRNYNLSFSHEKILRINRKWKLIILGLILILLVPFYYEINWLDHSFKPFMDGNGNYLPEENSFLRIGSDTFNTTLGMVSEVLYIIAIPEQYTIYLFTNTLEVLKFTIVWRDFAGTLPININEVITWVFSIWVALLGILNWYNIFGFSEKWIKFKQRISNFILSKNYLIILHKLVIFLLKPIINSKNKLAKDVIHASGYKKEFIARDTRLILYLFLDLALMLWIGYFIVVDYNARYLPFIIISLITSLLFLSLFGLAENEYVHSKYKIINWLFLIFLEISLIVLPLQPVVANILLSSTILLFVLFWFVGNKIKIPNWF